MLAAAAAGDEFERGEADEAEAEAGGDGVCQRNRNEGEKRGDGDARLVPLDARRARDHQCADEDERRSSGEIGNGSDEGRDENCGDEEQTGGDGSDPGAAAHRYS